MTTNPDLDQAREWAKSNLDKGHFAYGGRVMAAAHVIASLPDEWIDAEKVREFIEEWRTDCPTGDGPQILDQLESLLPTPPLPTLADMTDEERQACRWMQAKQYGHTGNESETVVIAQVMDEWVWIICADGRIDTRMHEYVVPLPDLPRMVWPCAHVAVGVDVSIIPPEIDTSTGHDDHVDMTPQAAPDGYYLVRWWGEEQPVPAEKVQGQWWVIGKPSMLPAKDVLIVSRLIQEGEQA